MVTPITPEKLQEIEDLAALQFTPYEVAIIAGVGDAGDEYDSYDPITQAMVRGNLKGQAEVRAGIFNHARHGSSPAQVIALELIEQCKVAVAGE